MLHNLVICSACGEPLSFTQDGARQCCDGPNGSALRSGFIIHDTSHGNALPQEMMVRDQDAFNYLSHPKFPTQIDRLNRFVRSKSEKENGGIVLDLGCGPGPTTGIVLDAGYKAVAVDFSIQSLAVNAQHCAARPDHALFVQGDLNTIEFSQSAFDGLMMADFLQHIGSAETQMAFLHKIFRALKPGGWFYLSFFNTSVVDRLKGDLEGRRGNIPYRRLSLREVRGMLPKGAVAEKESVMNIFNRPRLDRVATALPLAPLLAKMAVIEGQRIA